MVTSLYPLIQKANEFVGGPLMDWVAQHKELVKWLGLGTAALGVLLVALGGLGIVAGAVVSGLAAVVSIIGALFSPVTLVVVAVAAGATLIIMHWNKLVAFFKGLWQGITAGLAPLKGLGGQVAGWFSPLFAIGRAAYNFFLKPWVGAIAQLIGWFGRLLAPIAQSEAAAQAFGYRVGRGIAEAIKWVSQLAKAFFDLPGKLFEAGAAMMDMLIAGIKSKIAAVIGTVSGLTERIRGFFNHSPAKEGALKDIHQHTLSEMVASAIKPEPVVRALQAMTAAGLMALAPLTNPVVALATATPPAMASHGTGLSQPALMLPALAKLSAAPAMPAPATMPTLPPLSLPLPPAPKPALAMPAPATIRIPMLSQPAPLIPPAVVKLSATPAMPAPATMPALPPFSLPLPPTPAPAPRLAPSAAAQSGAAAPVTVHFAPQITVQGGGATTKDDIMAALKKHEHELVQLIEQVMARNARRQY